MISSHLLGKLLEQKEGVITGKQKEAIQSCAARADIS
jgi:hypothetical protein